MLDKRMPKRIPHLCTDFLASQRPPSVSWGTLKAVLAATYNILYLYISLCSTCLPALEQLHISYLDNISSRKVWFAWCPDVASSPRRSCPRGGLRSFEHGLLHDIAFAVSFLLSSLVHHLKEKIFDKANDQVYNYEQRSKLAGIFWEQVFICTRIFGISWLYSVFEQQANQWRTC